jgi:DNA-binding transcriptional MerR regulator
MDVLLSIGDFSKMTYLSVKALRHYHDVGLLAPADIDPTTGYRRYAASQVVTAQAIRRFRELDMPLDAVREVLEAPDEATRNRTILVHLERMQAQLEQTQQAVQSLQALLTPQAHPAGPVEIRRLTARRVLCEHRRVDFDEPSDWMSAAYERLRGVAADQGLSVVGADGALYPDELFAEGSGEVTAFVPIDGPPGPLDVELPAISAAVLLHEGSFADLDQAYAALGTIVTERGIGGPGPVREHYLSDGLTEVCWPITTSTTTTGATS